MNHPALFALLQNAALLLAMVVVFDVATSRRRFEGKPLRQVLGGMVLGLLGVGLMVTSFQLEPGIVFDTRSVLLCVSGLFLGTIPTLTAMAMTAAFRLWQGGAAAWTGAAVILASGGIGIAWRHYRRRDLAGISGAELYCLGLVVHVVMLALMLVLPWESAQRVLAAIGLPVMLIYPTATAALGLLMANRLQREAAAATLARSEEEFRNVFEHSPVGKSITGLDGSLRVNKAFCDMLGYSAQELGSKRWQDITHPDDIQASMERVQSLLDSKTVRERFEKRYVHKTGKTVWAEVSVVLQRDENQRPINFLTAVNDITQRKEAEMALRRVSSLLGMAGRMGRFGGWSVDLASRRVVWSDEVAAIHEMPPGHSPTLEEAIAFYAPEWREKITKVLAACAQEGAPYDEEMEIVTASGKRVWVRAIGEAVRDESGKITFAQGAFQDITERKKLQDELTFRGRQLNAFFKGATAGLVLMDRELRFIQINNTLAEINGLPAKEHLGRIVRDVLPKLAPVVEPIIRQVFATGEPVLNIEVTGETPKQSGVQRHWLESFFPVTGADGRVEAVGAIVVEITERKQAEASVLASERKWREVLVHIPQIGISLDPQARIVFANEHFLRLTGWKAQEVMGQDWFDLFVPPAIRDEVRKVFREVMTARDVGVFHSHENEILTHTGELRRIAWFNVLTKNAQGEVVDVTCLGVDLTERIRAEQNARESEQRFRRIYEQSPIAYQSLNVEGRLLDVNPAWLALLGCTREEALGRSFLDFLSPKSQTAFAERFPKLRRSGAIHGAEFELRRKDGESLIVAVDGVFVEDQPGQPAHTHCVLHNITERKGAEIATQEAVTRLETSRHALLSLIEDQKEAEAQVRRLNEELEQRVRDRTAQLEAANKEMEAFSYSVSHDLRAPLRGINGFANILTEDYAKLFDEEGRRLLSVICSEAGRMGQMIDELLTFSRLGRQSMLAGTVDMTALAQSVFDQCAAQTSGRDIRFKLQPLPLAMGDAAMLSHVWLNLISNAIKYTRGRPVAEIEISGRADGRGEVVYCVKDNGAGFDMRYVEKLFGVFQRLHSETEFEGTGVGLALVQRIVQRHGGRVWAEGEVNKGAAFYFALPASK